MVPILNNTTTGYEGENEIIELRRIIELYKTTCSYSMDEVFALQNLTIGMEHLDKADAYMTGNDITSIRSELNLSEDALNNATPFITAAKEKCFSIDIDTVQPGYKSGILEDKSALLQSEKLILELGKSSVDFSKSKNIIIPLKSSEFPEISIMAIEMDGMLGQIIKAIGHYELGCKYADGGNYEDAVDEFMKWYLAFGGASY